MENIEEIFSFRIGFTLVSTTLAQVEEQVGPYFINSVEDLGAFKGTYFKAIMLNLNFETTFSQPLNDFEVMPKIL